jgi:hypothetical protein
MDSSFTTVGEVTNVGNNFRKTVLLVAVGGLWLLTGCAAARNHAVNDPATHGAPARRPRLELTPDQEERVLALDPDRVTASDVSEVLSNLPAPRVVNIHGGIYPVHLAMESFSRFLIGMGYPEWSIRVPGSGAYSFSCYQNSEEIAGAVGWYYENEPLRPVIVGHSQGGMQAVKVLYVLARDPAADPVRVWNPFTRKREPRTRILDPLTGEAVAVAGLRLPYASAVGSGGFTRLLPNQWSMMGRLRTVPDSVEDFTGFSMGLDLFGGDFLGFGPMNYYHSGGVAVARNVRLPIGYNHVTVPTTRHLLESEATRDWINSYTPAMATAKRPKLEGNTGNLLWAADVWHSLKRHWVLELQRVIRVQRAAGTGQP